MFSPQPIPPPPVPRIVCSTNSYTHAFHAPDRLAPATRDGLPTDIAEGDCLGLAADPAGLVLAEGQTEGCFTSFVIGMPAFDWLVPSWSIAVPGSCSAEIHFQVWMERSWSIWYPLGTWSKLPGSHERKDDYGRVDTDTLVLKAARNLVRYRVCLKGTGGQTPCLRRFDFVTKMSQPGLVPGNLPPRDIELTVRPRSQMLEDPAIASRVCSPTSLAMGMSFFGVDVPTADLSRLCYDHGAKIYGNWSFNASILPRFGLAGRVDWFGSFGGLAGELEAGHPVIASIRFGEGELEGAPIRSTAGHLILVCGFARKEGRTLVIVADPAAPGPESVRREYDLGQFLKVWRGVVYIIEGRDQGEGRESTALQWE